MKLGQTKETQVISGCKVVADYDAISKPGLPACMFGRGLATAN